MITTVPLPLLAPAVEARGIAINYGAHCVLRNFNLRVKQGDITAVLGPSGVGKSSLLRTIAGLHKPRLGSVLIDAEVVKEPPHDLAMVFQDPCLLPWRTVAQNVSFGLDFKHQPRMASATRQARVARALAEVDLANVGHLRPAALSGGMAQRVGLARALARHSRLLLLDEPFSALDEVTRADMQRLLRRIVTDHDTTAILVTHDIDEALLVADQIVLVGGAPGEVLNTWQLSPDVHRDITSDTYSNLRGEILATLRQARDAPKADQAPARKRNIA